MFQECSQRNSFHRYRRDVGGWEATERSPCPGIGSGHSAQGSVWWVQMCPLFSGRPAALRQAQAVRSFVPGEWKPQARSFLFPSAGKTEKLKTAFPRKQSVLWEVPETPSLPKKTELLASVPHCRLGSVCPCQYFSMVPAGTQVKDSPFCTGSGQAG